MVKNIIISSTKQVVFLNNLDKYRLEKSLTYYSPPDIAWINSVFLKKYCWNVFRDIYESTSAYHYVLLVPPGSFFVHCNICMPCIHTAHPVMNTTKIWRQVNFFFQDLVVEQLKITILEWTNGLTICLWDL